MAPLAGMSMYWPSASATPTSSAGVLPDTAVSGRSPGPLAPVVAVVVFGLALAVRIRQGLGSRQ